MHAVIVAPLGGTSVILRPGSPKAIKVGGARFAEIQTAAAGDGTVPDWLADAAATQWGIALHDRPAAGNVLVRAPGPYRFSRATWEINLGCDYDCEMCYLGKKRFEGLDREGKRRLLRIIRDAGVIWLQITGGEPLIDPGFSDAYEHAHELGMVIELLSNGSRLHNERVFGLLTERPPSKLTLSVYGASAETYDAVTRRRGAFNRFTEGLHKALDAGLNIDLSLILLRRNAHEQEVMRAWANELGLPYREYANISPTIHGTDETLPSQSPEHLTQRTPFRGCPAGHTPIRSGVPPFARWAASRTSTWSRKESKGWPDSAVSPIPSCFAPEDAPAARCPARAGCAGRWPRSSRRRRHHWRTIANTEAGDVMTAVMVEISPTRTAVKEDAEAVVLIEDVDTLTDESLPGCGDDNPYN
ncbi:radical SAM protein [Streptomyces canus]|uniref:radical SAM protein n=1 Tax=Streptomyces canus TaxID=58343 RepID=UPI002E2DD248|nr:radical SAM protein [Streptomyces canus]